MSKSAEDAEDYLQWASRAGVAERKLHELRADVDIVCDELDVTDLGPRARELVHRLRQAVTRTA